ncbi:MAG TPA: ABC transporter substrate-binding protein [Bacillota bacterium]|nr:ABC transporter substrate-binding protein [Bacillota bacterium]HOH09894.1 ABC transporter substrate-binding protein [Bacillota bacterium]HOS50556.1 ABC transporter substrate-binding protein [Bacillota bacterium]HOY88190.1 ABC transporter substrate-binding protein [Bacillota bacterium]HPI00693.1 ABC transporter substrate-binding protein [Bacillota bacterium]
MKRAVTRIVLAALLAATLMFGGIVFAAQEITIGLVVPLTGGSAGPGIALQQGTLLAADLINAQGGVNGMMIKVLCEDDESNPVKTVNAVKKLISVNKAVTIIGSNASSCTLAAMDEAQKAKVPLITPSSSSDEITQLGNKFIFRVTASNSTQAKALVDYAVTTLKLKKYAIVHSSDDYGTNAMEAVVTRLAEKYNIKPAVIEAFQPKDRDFSSQMTKVKNSGADGLFFLAMYDPAALGAKTLQQMGCKVQIMGLGALTDVRLVQLAGDAVLGTINTQMYVPEGKTADDKAFIKAFQTKYNVTPNYYAALAYDSLMVAADAIKRAGSLDPIKIREELAKTKDFKGIGGELTFDSTGDVSRNVKIVKVVGVNPPSYEVIWPK